MNPVNMPNISNDNVTIYVTNLDDAPSFTQWTQYISFVAVQVVFTLRNDPVSIYIVQDVAGSATPGSSAEPFQFYLSPFPVIRTNNANLIFNTVYTFFE
jgi:hypothetical protein